MAENRSLRQFLDLLAASGISHLPTVTLPEPPVRRGLKLKQPPTSAAKSVGRAPRERASSTIKAPPPLPQTLSILQQPRELASDKAAALQQLAELVAGCQRCGELAESRRQTVFGIGDPNARLMFIGEAPGADEDREGEPFVGAAGQLLNKIIHACGLKRDDIYICNVLRCRPPGNRNPQPQEAVNCREFLDGQIEIVQPEYIVCWGTVAAQNLLAEKRPVGQLRGQFLQHGDAKVLCTYHPSYLLRNPAAKKQVWEDMKLLMHNLGVDLP